jgi:transposase
MAPHNDSRQAREEKNTEILALHNYTTLGYDKIAKTTGVAKSTVRAVIKRGRAHDAQRSGRPTKVTAISRKIVEKVVDDNGRLPLRDITNKANEAIAKTASQTLGYTTVDTILRNAPFKLIKPRKKPFWRKGQKEKRKQFACRRRTWNVDQWKKVVFVDESTIEYNPNPVGERIRIRPGHELDESNLQASFKSGRTNVGVYAAIAFGRRTNLIMIRKRTPAERTPNTDRLGLNANQYANEIHQPHLIPFMRGFPDTPDHLFLAADGAAWHKGAKNRKLCEDCGYSTLPWPPNSPDLNPIENAWLILKSRLRSRWRNSTQTPHSVEELFAEACEEWEKIPQKTIDNWIEGMPGRMQAVLDANGGHTKW